MNSDRHCRSPALKSRTVLNMLAVAILFDLYGAVGLDFHLFTDRVSLVAH